MKLMVLFTILSLFTIASPALGIACEGGSMSRQGKVIAVASLYDKSTFEKIASLPQDTQLDMGEERTDANGVRWVVVSARSEGRAVSGLVLASKVIEVPAFTQNSIGEPSNAGVPRESSRTAVRGKVHALIIGLSRDSEIGPGIASSGSYLEQSLLKAFPEPQSLKIYVIGIDSKMHNKNASTFDRQTIEAEISKIKQSITPGVDTMFCYVMGHGFYDSENSTRQNEYGHFFQTEKPTESISRLELMTSLLSTNSKLTVLISDTCNVPVKVYQGPQIQKGVEPKEFEVLRTLLTVHTGVVDLSASSQGQFSFYSDYEGVFTSALLDLARSYRKDATWPEFFAALQDATQTEFDRTFPKGAPWVWDETTQKRKDQTPGQRELRPFAMRPISGAVPDSLLSRH